LSFSSSSSIDHSRPAIDFGCFYRCFAATYTWYKDNVLINGQTGSTLAHHIKNGAYKVDVKQNQGCLKVKKLWNCKFPIQPVLI
jgi:hypothetical protein